MTRKLKLKITNKYNTILMSGLKLTAYSNMTLIIL